MTEALEKRTQELEDAILRLITSFEEESSIRIRGIELLTMVVKVKVELEET